MRRPSYFEHSPISFAEAKALHGYRAFCDRTQDGDTYDFIVDLGFYNIDYIAIRLLALDTPEITRPKSEEERLRGLLAKAYAADLIDQQVVVLVPERQRDGDEKSTFTRFVADVYYKRDNGTFAHLATELEKAGYAK